MERRHLIRFGVWIAASATALTLIAVSTAPAQAAYPGANGRIVYDTAWSFWNGGGTSQIYSVQPNGDDVRQLTHVAEGTAAWHPAVSPSGTRIAYVYSADGSNDQVWIMRANGSHQQLVVDEPDWSGTGPSFTADGSRLLYSRCGNYVAFYWTCKIVSVRLDGSDRRTIIGGTWHPSDPVMSPDGDTIAYVSDAGGYDARIWLANANGTHRRVLGANTILVERPMWSPDGTHLVFTDSRYSRIFTIRVDGNGLKQVASHSIFGAWSPDGCRLVFKGDGRSDGFGPLRTTNTDGTDPVRVVGFLTGVGYSDWGIRP